MQLPGEDPADVEVEKGARSMGRTAGSEESGSEVGRRRLRGWSEPCWVGEVFLRRLQALSRHV